MDDITGLVRELIKLAKELKEIDSGVLWIIVCLSMGAIVIYDKREAYRKDMADREIRGLKSIVETKTADALVKLGDAYDRLASRFEIAIDILRK